MHNNQHRFNDESLRQYVDAEPYMTSTRRLVPSGGFELGLANRGEQDRRGHLRDKSYFLKAETPLAWGRHDGANAWGREHRERWASGEPYAPELIYTINVLYAYAYTAGWRAVPGIRWACGKVDRPDLAEDYESTIRALVRDCDAVHRLLAKKPTKAFMLDAGDNLTRPLLADIRRATANAIGALRRYPELRDDLPEPEDMLRFGRDTQT